LADDRETVLAAFRRLLELEFEIVCTASGGRELVTGAELNRILRYLLDQKEFLSDHGTRSISRFHLEYPYVCCGGHDFAG